MTLFDPTTDFTFRQVCGNCNNALSEHVDGRRVAAPESSDSELDFELDFFEFEFEKMDDYGQFRYRTCVRTVDESGLVAYDEDRDYLLPAGALSTSHYTQNFRGLSLDSDTRANYGEDGNHWTDAWEADPYERFADNLNEWFDKDPEQFASTLEEMQAMEVVTATEQVIERNYYIDGVDGFFSIQLYDVKTTERYHARLLNVYRDWNGTLAVGSVRVHQEDDNLTIRCVNKKCRHGDLSKPEGFSFNPSMLTPDQMETWTLAVIRHGNNCAAQYIAEELVELLDADGNVKVYPDSGKPITVSVGPRADFYKIHGSDCDLKCGSRFNPCNKKSPRPQRKAYDLDPSVFEDTDDLLWFLAEHRRYCTDTKCYCEVWTKVLSENDLSRRDVRALSGTRRVRLNPVGVTTRNG